MNRIATGLLAGAVAVAGAAVLRSRPPGGQQRWQRTNFRGQQVSLLGGIASAAGASTAAVATGGLAGAGAAIVVGTGAVLGAIDDADTTSTSKGLRGHIDALRRGTITTGLGKLVGISAAGLIAAAVATAGGRRSSADGVLARVGDVATSGVLIAATANVVNLFDLRPGRALKVVGIVNAPLALVPGPAGRLACGALGAVAASLEADLAEQTMLGDAGANALGALSGMSLALVPSRRFRIVATAVAAALIIVSEKVSFSKVIAATPGLRDIDAWGRQG